MTSQISTPRADDAQARNEAFRSGPVLRAGMMLRGAGFTRAFKLSTAQSFAREYGADPQVAYDNAVRRGHETAWAINAGSALTDEPAAVKAAKAAQEAAAFAEAVFVLTGEVYMIEGVPQRCTVHGERFSDAIVFRPV